MSLNKLKRGLIIEDDTQVRRILELLLEKVGIQVFLRTSGEEAIESYPEVDFFITDYILPGKNGIEVAKHLSENFLLPGIVTSGKPLAQKDLPNKTIFLSKPFGNDELIAALQKLSTL